jgi:hypothetical protein
MKEESKTRKYFIRNARRSQNYYPFIAIMLAGTPTSVDLDWTILGHIYMPR